MTGYLNISFGFITLIYIVTTICIKYLWNSNTISKIYYIYFSKFAVSSTYTDEKTEAEITEIVRFVTQFSSV